MEIKEIVQIIFGVIALICVIGVVLIALIIPIYEGIVWWGYKSRQITGAWDVPSLNAARGRCDYMYHKEKISYNELPEWCQKYKIKYENYKPVGIIPQ